MDINRPGARQVTRELDELIKQPVYSISPSALREYEDEYFAKKCTKSRTMIREAQEVIPGGVQHNLAFNHPFPLVFTGANGNKLPDLDGNE